MVARRRRMDRGKIIGIVIVIIVIILLYLWFKVHKISVNYFVFSLIISIAWAISLIIFTRSLMKHLWQVPPLPKKRMIAGLGFLALLFIIIIVIIIVSFLYAFPTANTLLIINIANATLVEYKLLYCCKACGGVPLNQTAISPVGSNETMFVKAALSQSFIGLFIEIFVTVFLLGLWLLTTYLLKALLEYSTGDKEKAYNTLCRDDRRLLSSYIAMTLITYFTGFSIIVLAILSSSEFPYAYAMLITTFLVLIAEVLMIRNGMADSPWPWVALFISVVSSLLYTVVTFYIGGFILPSTCLTGIDKDVLGIYEFSLPLAGISGAISYALTLLIIHHRIMCPRVETEKTDSVQ